MAPLWNDELFKKHLQAALEEILGAKGMLPFHPRTGLPTRDVTDEEKGLWSRLSEAERSIIDAMHRD